MVLVAGRPFLEHQLELLSAHGFSRVVICVGHLGHIVERRLGAGRRRPLDVRVAHEGPEPIGTAAAIRGALPFLDDRFLVLFGDTYLRIDYGDVARAHALSGLPALMTVLRNRDRWAPSNAIYRRGRVLAYAKRAPPPGAEWIDYGLSVLTADAIVGSDLADLADLMERLASAGQLAGYAARNRFYEIGTPAALAETERFLRGHGRST
jgi:NDP-sugar pyrophosphorylase family protein